MENEVSPPPYSSAPLSPRYPLGIFPTPLIEAQRLSAALNGPRILIKRDDMTGFGFGGNKVRILEYYLADALAQEADIIVTAGGPQSNHVRATAAAARVAGLRVVAILHGSRPDEYQGNLLLNELLDTEVQFTNSPDRVLVDRRLEEVAAELREAGRHPYLIPRGGATALGALGYVECVREMEAQLAQMGAHATWIVLATGSCGTQAGLLAGAKICAAPYRVLGVTVSRPVAECRERIERIAGEVGELAGHPVEVSPDDIRVLGDFIGAGYGIPTPEGVEAIRLVARTEGLFFDPTYTGKGMAGLIGEIQSGRIGKDDTVVFLHTGGEPALFAHPEIVDPPVCSAPSARSGLLSDLPQFNFGGRKSAYGFGSFAKGCNNYDAPFLSSKVSMSSSSTFLSCSALSITGLISRRLRRDYVGTVGQNVTEDVIAQYV